MNRETTRELECLILRMSFGISGIRETTTISVSEDDISYEKTTERMSGDKEIEKHELKVGVKQWLEEFNKVPLDQWSKGNYLDLYIIDGGSWDIAAKFKGNEAIIDCGGNIWPDDWQILTNLIDIVREGDSLIQQPGQINHYCYRTTVKDFRNLSQADWLDEMVSNFHNVNENEVNDSQLEAWKDSFQVLLETVKELPPQYDGIHMVFEYVLPMFSIESEDNKTDPGVRPDVLMISKDTVIVLEFKDREERYKGCAAQAREYRKRIQEWHKQSIGMNKKAILVFTKTEGLKDKHFKVRECSPDNLTSIITEFFGPEPEFMTGLELFRWINTEYVDRSK